MNNLYTYFASLFIFCTAATSYAQISFSDETYLLTQEEHFSGVSMSVIDMNGDGLDDIVRQDLGVNLNIEIQNQPGQKYTRIEGPRTGIKSQWAMCVADVDNDGVNEILTGGVNDEVVLFKIDDNSNTFTKTILEGSENVFVQGSNFADINNDGFVDIFVCHDDAESRIWENDGNGGFISRDDWIDMSVNGDSGEGASGNYGSTWMDIDNDGDIDLYIAKCRQGVTDITDKRRINQLYINDGNGNFTEEAESRGLAVYWQSWTADFQDINNDGWLDCFITNHDHSSQLFLNDGTGHFTELSNTGVEVFGLPIQGLMRDFDNDGWVDIITTGSRAQVFRNNKNLTFTELSNPFDDNKMESLALGDLNDDGYLDVYGGYAKIFTTPSTINDKLWLNRGGSNNYLTVSLIGVQSNRNAIGAKVEIFGDWGVQVREVRSGESYGISNSNNSYFGVGQSETIDSVLIHWPSGMVQKEYDIDVNAKLKIVEGRCLAKSPAITLSGPTTFCPGNNVVLTAEDGFESYQWTNGSQATTITVSESGNYTLEVTDAAGCLGYSENVFVSVNPALYPEIIAQGNTEVCNGEEEIVLSVLNVDVEESDIEWSDGSFGFDLIANTSGMYNVNVAGLCDEFESNTIEVILHDIPEEPQANDVTIQAGEIAVLDATGDDLAWYASELSEDAIGYGPSIEIEGLTENTSFFVESRSGSGSNDKVGMENHEGSFYSQNTNISEGLRFDVFDALTLDSIKVYTDLPGNRKIVLFDRFFQEVTSTLIYIEEGESTLYLGFDIPEGENYLLGTDIFQNLETTGGFSPRLRRSDQNVNFPYLVEDKLEINGSDFGQAFYYYFYDWTISSGVFCASDRAEVKVEVDGSVSTLDIDDDQFTLYPNPNNGKFLMHLASGFSSTMNYTVSDIAGKILHQGKRKIGKEVEVDLILMPGIYILRLGNESETFVEKFIVE